MSISNLDGELNFCASLLNSTLNLHFNFKIETKFLITFEKIQFQMFAFEKLSHDNKFNFSIWLFLILKNINLNKKVGIDYS